MPVAHTKTKKDNQIMKRMLSKSRNRFRSPKIRGLNRPRQTKVRRTVAETSEDTLPPELLKKIDAWWRAANYLSVGQTYLYDNPLLKHPLRKEHVKPRLVGHWGTTPGLNFIYVHLNRVIKERDLNMIYIIGPGHGGPGIVANTWLE